MQHNCEGKDTRYELMLSNPYKAFIHPNYRKLGLLER